MHTRWIGLAGGPLVVAMLLSRLGNIGKLYWFMPPSANKALRELGIVLFLAVVGLKSGAGFVDTLLTDYFGSFTFIPPGKVSDFFGFQYMRGIDADGKGHNPMQPEFYNPM